MISHKPERMFGRSTGTPESRRDFDSREGYDERLDHILEAATRVMARVGYEKASMRMVSKAAGVSLAGMYHYFDSKEQMLFLIEFRTFNSLLNRVKEKLQGVQDPFEQLFAMIRVHVAYFASHMEALKVCSHELDSLSGDRYNETREVRRAYYEVTRGIIDRILDQQAVAPNLDRHVLTMSLFGTLNWMYRWYNPKSDRSPSTVANQIAGTFLFGALGPPSGMNAGAVTGSSPGAIQRAAAKDGCTTDGK